MRPIPELTGYKASASGRIFGPRGELSQFLRKGYWCVQAANKQRKVSRLVCAAYHGLPPSGAHQAAHLNGDSTDNFYANLQWKTPQQNSDDKKLHGTALRRESHPRAKLTEVDVCVIRHRRKQGEQLRSIHRDFPGVCYATLSHVVNNRNWKS